MRLVLKAWGILQSFWSSVHTGVMEKLILMSVMESYNRIDGFAIENRRQAGKEQFPPSVSFYLIKKILHGSAQHPNAVKLMAVIRRREEFIWLTVLREVMLAGVCTAGHTASTVRTQRPWC